MGFLIGGRSNHRPKRVLQGFGVANLLLGAVKEVLLDRDRSAAGVIGQRRAKDEAGGVYAPKVCWMRGLEAIGCSFGGAVPKVC